jgi:LCP family protein required for cell wall assembly
VDEWQEGEPGRSGEEAGPQDGPERHAENGPEYSPDHGSEYGSEHDSGSGPDYWRPRTRPADGVWRPPAGPAAAGTVNRDVDLAELDPHGRVGARRAPGGPVRSGRTPNGRTRRRKTLEITTGAMAGLVLVTAGLGTYLSKHLFGNIDTVSLSGLTNRPAAEQPDAEGNTAQNILVLGSQTRDGQTGVNLGNSSKLGTDISDTAMLVHISAEKKWAVVVSIPRDLLVPRPQCQGRTDPNLTVPASGADMFDLAMNLGGPACAVSTVEQMTGMRVDHFVELTFNAFQELTSAVGGVQVCVPPPGINDPYYSGLVLDAGLHTVTGAQALEFVRDRHGVGNGTDLGRIQYQQMFASSLLTKLTSDGTLSNPATLLNIANAVTSNLTVDPGLDSLPSMVSLAESVRTIKTHFVQLITAPYDFDPTNDNRVIPGAGFDQVWTDLRNDQPLPGSNAATEFGTTGGAIPSGEGGGKGGGSAGGAAGGSAASADSALSGLSVTVYNGTETAHLAANATANLSALGVHATVGHSGYNGYATSEILYPAGQRASAQALSGQVVGALLKQSDAVRSLTLVLGQNAPANLTANTTAVPSGAAGTNGGNGTVGSGSDGSDNGGDATGENGVDPMPSATISAESRDGDQDICSALPTPVAYGGRP